MVPSNFVGVMPRAHRADAALMIPMLIGGGQPAVGSLCAEIFR
jgi:hypothetical protein